MEGVFLPAGGTIRARGYVTGGGAHPSNWFVESSVSVTRPMTLQVSRNGSNLLLHWTGGQGPYQVQQTTNLNDPNSWRNLGTAEPTNSLSLPIGPGNTFWRVVTGLGE